MDRSELKGTLEYLEKYFPIVRASELSLEDEFLKHEPRSSSQRRLKKALIEAIENGLSDFRAQRIDPSVKDNKIFFEKGAKPGVGKTPRQWKRLAEEFLPEKESRLGTTEQRVAFLGVLIKTLIEKGYRIRDAWKAVCDRSEKLGHYWDSENAQHKFEPTGSRQVGKWCDLGNTKKITIDDDIIGGFSEFGGYYGIIGYLNPLGERTKIYYLNGVCKYSTGWIVTNV